MLHIICTCDSVRYKIMQEMEYWWIMIQSFLSLEMTSSPRHLRLSSWNKQQRHILIWCVIQLNPMSKWWIILGHYLIYAAPYYDDYKNCDDIDKLIVEQKNTFIQNSIEHLTLGPQYTPGTCSQGSHSYSLNTSLSTLVYCHTTDTWKNESRTETRALKSVDNLLATILWTIILAIILEFKIVNFSIGRFEIIVGNSSVDGNIIFTLE